MPGQDRGRRPPPKRELTKEQEATPIERVIGIQRISKATKGGKRMSFSALVVVGDGKGTMGWALGRANEVAEAIRKGFYQARKHAFPVPLRGTTIPHEVMGVFSASKVMLKPAAQGTGVIAGGSVRSVCEVAGIHDVLAKSMGSGNAINVVQATVEGLQSLRNPKEVVAARKDQVDATG